MNKPSKLASLPVTLAGPKPGNFPLHSPESRAAARILAGQREDQRERITIVMHAAYRPPDETYDEPRATPWKEGEAGLVGLVRTLVVPVGMTADEAGRMADHG